MSLRAIADEQGQYMVEFALSFVVFVLFIFFVIDLGILIYNHNLFYHAVARGARQAGLGASNSEIKESAGQIVTSRYFPTLTFIAHPQPIQVKPEREMHRVDGREVRVSMDSIFGFSLLGMYQFTVELPVRSRTLIVQQNDQDRDGCKDSLEGPGKSCDGYQFFPNTNPNDHDNNGTVDEYRFDGSDTDADGDGIKWSGDTLTVAYMNNAVGAGYFISRQPSLPLAGAANQDPDGRWWEEWFGGTYHAPPIWDDKSEAPSKLFRRKVPSWPVKNSGRDEFMLDIRVEYDMDNDGWEDKFDDHPNNPLAH